MRQQKEFEAFDTAWNGSYDNTKETLDKLLRQMDKKSMLLVGGEQDGYRMAMRDLVRHFDAMNNARMASPKRNRCLLSYLRALRVGV